MSPSLIQAPLPCLFTGCQESQLPWSWQDAPRGSTILGTVQTVFSLVLIYTILFANVTKATKVVQRPNYGILFQPAGRMQATYNKWSHTFQLTMPRRLEVKNATVTCPKTKSTVRHPCTTFVNALHRAHAIRMRSASTLNSLRDRIIALVPKKRQAPTMSQSKRSLLPFIGQISRTLFGTATEEEVQTLAKHIVALEKRSQQQGAAFTRHAEEMSSFMSATAEHFSTLSAEILANHQVLTDVSFTLRSYGLAIDAAIQLSIALAEEGHLTGQLQEQFSLLFQGVHELTQHRLSPTLLPLPMVKHTFNNIANSLASSHPEFQVAIKANQLYNSRDFFWTFRNDSIFITVGIPLLTQAVVLDVYKVLSVPVPLHRSSSHVTQLLDIPRYIAFSADGLYYTMPDPDKWLSCGRRPDEKFCQIDTPLIQSSTPSCLTAIYNQQMASVKRLCDFRFLEHALTSAVVNVRPGRFLISNISRLTMTCQSDVKTIPGCNYCIMDIPCLCAISAGHFYIPPHLQSCKGISSKSVKQLHPVNLALLLHFQEMESINHLHGNSLYPHPVDFPTPDFKLYNHTYDGLVGRDIKESLGLKHMVSRAKSDAVIYRNLAEPVLADISGDSILGSTSWWWTLIPIVVSAFSLVGTVYLFWKVRTLAACITILKQTRGVNAFSVDRVIHLFTSTVSPYSPTPFTAQVCTHDIASYLVALAILATVCLLLYRVYKRNKHHSTIFLELSAGSRCVKIPITDIPTCPRNYHFQASLWVKDIRVNGCLQPGLSVDWQDLLITNTLSHQVVVLPDRLPVSLCQAMQLRYLLKQHFYALLFVRHSQFSFYVQVCQRPCHQCNPILTGMISHHTD